MCLSYWSRLVVTPRRGDGSTPARVPSDLPAPVSRAMPLTAHINVVFSRPASFLRDPAFCYSRRHRAKCGAWYFGDDTDRRTVDKYRYSCPALQLAADLLSSLFTLYRFLCLFMYIIVYVMFGSTIGQLHYPRRRSRNMRM